MGSKKGEKVTNKMLAYLPYDKPPLGQSIAFGFQHVLTMFPATVLVAILTGFDVGVTVAAAGAFTVVGLLLSRMRIPLFYGSSFSYIAVLILAVQRWGVQVAQVGIVVTGVLQILVGLGVDWLGIERLKRIVPTIVAGSAALIIGFALAPTAINMSTGNTILEKPSTTWLFVALLTLTVTGFAAVLLRKRGFIGMLPVVIGAAVGYIVSIPLGLVNFAPVAEAAWFQVPKFTLPDFTNQNALSAAFAISLMAIATIPESIAHLFQTSLYVDKQAEELGQPTLRIRNLVGLNLKIDGFIDVLRGMVGAVAGTNYGENISLMVITRNYSSWAVLVGGVIAVALAFVGKLMALVATLPTPVSGGLAIYLFAVIGFQGVALMAGDVPGAVETIIKSMEAVKLGLKEEALNLLSEALEKLKDTANLFDPLQLLIGAFIVGIGLGGGTAGIIPGLGWPSIATGVLAGLILNFIFEFVIKREGATLT